MIALLPVGLIGCKSTKKQETVAVPEKEKQTNKPTVVVLDKPIKISIDHLKIDTSATVAREKAATPGKDSLFASIKHTPCYGRCPIFSAKIYNSGYAVYEGKRFVERIGVYSTRFSKDQMDQIIKKANDIGYFSLEDQYDRPVTDFPTTHTTLNAGRKSKTIKNRVGGPESLKEYENFLDSLLNNASWTKMADNNQ